MNVNILLFIGAIIIAVIIVSIHIFKSDIPFFNKIVNFIGFLSFVIVILNILTSSYVYFTLKDSVGNVGPKGSRGLKGKKGANGICTSTCGQQSCIGLIESKINDHLKDKGPLSNTILKNKINQICFSDNYQGFLHSNVKNKPNEQKLIDYLGDTILKWIDLLLKTDNGSDFITTPDMDETVFDANETPFNEFKKYEIWGWGGSYTFKPIIRKQCVDKTKYNFPKSDLADIHIIYTDTYDKPLFRTKKQTNRWGPDDCPYNQLGHNNENPDATDFCYNYSGSDITGEVSHVKTWIEKEYIGFNQDFSFFNPLPITINKLNYWPVGTVWRGNDMMYRDMSDTKTLGPKKKTILIWGVSDKIQDPIRFDPIWSTVNISDYDPTKQSDNDLDVITIWRPIPPKNFVSLGDYVTHDLPNNPPDVKNTIKCVSINCVNEFPIKDNSNVWSNDGYSIIKKKSPDDKGKTITFNKDISIWPCGIFEAEEEVINYSNSKIDPLHVGGYNLFRANNKLTKPISGKAYELNPECYSIEETSSHDSPTNKLGVGWLGGKQRENKYSVFSYLNYALTGIISNYDIEKLNIPTYDTSQQVSYYIQHIDAILPGESIVPNTTDTSITTDSPTLTQNTSTTISTSNTSFSQQTQSIGKNAYYTIIAKDSNGQSNYLKYNYKTITDNIVTNVGPIQLFHRENITNDMLWKIKIKDSVKDSGNTYPLITIDTLDDRSLQQTQAKGSNKTKVSLVNKQSSSGTTWKYNPSTGYTDKNHPWSLETTVSPKN